MNEEAASVDVVVPFWTIIRVGCFYIKLIPANKATIKIIVIAVLVLDSSTGSSVHGFLRCSLVFFESNMYERRNHYYPFTVVVCWCSSILQSSSNSAGITTGPILPYVFMYPTTSSITLPTHPPFFPLTLPALLCPKTLQPHPHSIIYQQEIPDRILLCFMICNLLLLQSCFFLPLPPPYHAVAR